MKIKNFRGVFSRDDLPSKPKIKECGIINLNELHEPGSHWVAYIKNKDLKLYFDSFGDLPPPPELYSYLGKNIRYNIEKFQTFDEIVCGHLCLSFLKKWEA